MKNKIYLVVVVILTSSSLAQQKVYRKRLAWIIPRLLKQQNVTKSQAKLPYKIMEKLVMCSEIWSPSTENGHTFI